MGACKEGWKAVEGYSTWQDFWENCERGDWLLWVLGKKAGEPWSIERRKLVGTACKCARLAWEWMPEKSRNVLVVFECWARGKEISQTDLQVAAADAAAAAYEAAEAKDAADAAYAAYDAAEAYDAAADAYDAAWWDGRYE